MKDSLTAEEFKTAMMLVNHLDNNTVSEELERLSQRELDLLNVPTITPEDREIILYNLVVLSAASARIKHAIVIEEPSYSLTDTEESG
jgi:hypothetical protein